jgi:hypothetical protein
MDIYDFMNSKTLFRTVRYESRFEKHVPVMVHVNYHPDKYERLQSVWKKYVDGDAHALDHYPIGELAGAAGAAGAGAAGAGAGPSWLGQCGEVASWRTAPSASGGLAGLGSRLRRLAWGRCGVAGPARDPRATGQAAAA